MANTLIVFAMVVNLANSGHTAISCSNIFQVQHFCQKLFELEKVDFEEGEEGKLKFVEILQQKNNFSHFFVSPG